MLSSAAELLEFKEYSCRTPLNFYKKKYYLRKKIFFKNIKKGEPKSLNSTIFGTIFVQLFSAKPIANGLTRNYILSSDSENEAEAVTKNAQTTPENDQVQMQLGFHT